ncbi:MAG: helix-turn-helix transcriptional regulator [Candidatus Atribacteria bacterium]|nr:helix-turn-helix transcriptional regulator [Candidatus Atribacteria bacterium]
MPLIDLSRLEWSYRLASALAQRKTHGELYHRWQSLSPREQEVTALACRGYTNRQIAARLGVSAETVKTHVRGSPGSRTGQCAGEVQSTREVGTADGAGEVGFFGVGSVICRRWGCEGVVGL